MRLSDHYAVPSGAALLYDFVNTLDERHYVADGVRLEGSDALATPALLADWLERHGLNEGLDAAKWQYAVALRHALRSYLGLSPRARVAAAPALDAAASAYPLKVATDADGGVVLVPQAGSDTLAIVLVQLHALAAAGQLDRLKTCADSDCRWIFLDRSKPGSRRWCSSTGCGNRQKTRAYRARRGGGDAAIVSGGETRPA